MNDVIEKLVSRLKPSKDELEAKLEKLRKDRYNARSNKEHHARQMRKAIDKADMKKYQGHHAKRDYWDGRLKKIRSDILLVKEAIRAQEEKERIASYKKGLKAFDKAMVTGLKELLLPLDKLIEKQVVMGDISGLADRVYRFYEDNKKKFDSKDLGRYHQLGLLSMKIRIGNILEKVGDMERTANLRGNAVAAEKRQKVIFWSTHLANQIRDCIKAVKKRGK